MGSPLLNVKIVARCWQTPAACTDTEKSTPVRSPTNVPTVISKFRLFFFSLLLSILFLLLYFTYFQTLHTEIQHETTHQNSQTRSRRYEEQHQHRPHSQGWEHQSPQITNPKFSFRKWPQHDPLDLSILIFKRLCILEWKKDFITNQYNQNNNLVYQKYNLCLAWFIYLLFIL